MTFWALDRCSSSNINRAIAFQSFHLFWDPMTSSMKHSMIVCKGVFTIQWCISTLSLKVISLFVLQLSWKCYFFIHKGIYRETTLRSLCDVIDDVITMKIFFLALFGTIFQYLMSNWSCNEYLKKFQNYEILELGRTFLLEVSPEVEHIIQKAKSMPYILSFWSTF